MADLIPSPFRPAQVAALRTLAELWKDRPFSLVGAAALRCQLDLRWRRTEDLDISLAVSIDEYPGGLDGVPGWSRHPRHEHEWHGPDAVYVDLLPAGPGLLKAGKVVWPRSGFVMNLAGFRHAFAQARPLVIEPGLTIPVAPVHVIALLKMISYLDRPAQRERDLIDLGYMLDEYLNPRDNRRYSDRLVASGVDHEDQGAFALGDDVGGLVDAAERGLVERFLDEAESDGSLTQVRMVDKGPRRWDRDCAPLLRLVTAFRRGLAG